MAKGAYPSNNIRGRKKRGRPRVRAYSASHKYAAHQQVASLKGTKGAFETDVVTIGDELVMAQLEGLMPDFKLILAGQQRKILREQFAKPARRSKTLIPWSKKPPNAYSKYRLDSTYPERGRFWPRVHLPERPGKGYGTKFDKIRSQTDNPGNYVAHRKHLRRTVRVAPPNKRQPWNHASVLWGHKSVGVYHFALMAHKHGDPRPIAISKYGGRVLRQFGLLYKAVLKENGIENARIGAQRALLHSNPDLLKRHAAQLAFKKRSRSKAVRDRMEKYEHKGIASMEKHKTALGKFETIFNSSQFGDRNRKASQARLLSKVREYGLVQERVPENLRNKYVPSGFDF